MKNLFLIFFTVLTPGYLLANGAQAQQANPLMSFAPLVIIFFIFYFLMIRPQKKKMEEEQKFINSLQKGDEVFTKSGILGKIHGLTEKVVTLEVAEGLKIKILRHQVAGSQKILDQSKNNSADSNKK